MARRLYRQYSLALLALIIPLINMSAAVSWDNSIPSLSHVLEGYENVDSVRSRLATMPLHHIEGIWQLGSDQAIVAIERCSNPAVAPPGLEFYQIVIIDSPRCSVAPGTVLGYTAPTGRRDTYDARLYTSVTRSLLHRHDRFTLRLDSDDSHLALTPVRSGWKILLRNTFHFLMRVGIYHDPQADTDINGFTRIFPASTGRPAQPVYL